MTVSIASPKEDLIFDGEYDPMVAEENEARYFLQCDECGMKAKGTTLDLHEAGWSWEMTVDAEEVFVKESEASCPKCNGAQSEEDQSLHEKASDDKSQLTLEQVDDE